MLFKPIVYYLQGLAKTCIFLPFLFSWGYISYFIYDYDVFHWYTKLAATIKKSAEMDSNHRCFLCNGFTARRNRHYPTRRYQAFIRLNLNRSSVHLLPKSIAHSLNDALSKRHPREKSIRIISDYPETRLSGFEPESTGSKPVVFTITL